MRQPKGDRRSLLRRIGITARSLNAFGACLAVTACAAGRGAISTSRSAETPCAVADADARWLDAALAASRDVARQHGLPVDSGRTEVFAFDADCLVTIVADGSRRYRAHDGTVILPSGPTAARITAFAAPSPSGNMAFFTMAMPSVWESAGFRSEVPIAAFTLGVLAHEISHVRQFGTYLNAIPRIRAALTEAEGIFLTLEGSGQWYALQALVSAPSGPRLPQDVAVRAFAQRGGRWSQDLGLAITMVLDRLDPQWPQRVYGPGGETVLQLLDRALATR
jgi:hypothetical protein